MVYFAHPNKRVSVIAHSFGTYVISCLLRDEFDIRFHRVIFCGSVVPYDFPFENFVSKFQPPPKRGWNSRHLARDSRKLDP
jgi:pimeloyl-ACP methyl ester carboxylesterase